MTARRRYSTYAVQRRASRRGQDKDDDAFYAEQARKRREAEAQAAPPESLASCAAARDGECGHAQCPQLRDSEPATTGRHCPFDNHNNED